MEKEAMYNWVFFEAVAAVDPEGESRGQRDEPINGSIEEQRVEEVEGGSGGSRGVKRALGSAGAGTRPR
jgi:hypothetical protein